MWRIRWFFLLMTNLSLAQAANLQSIDVISQTASPAIQFTLDGVVSHKVFTLTNPFRVVIDFNNTHLAVNLNRLNFNKQLIKRIRSGYPNSQTLRLVFEVSQPVMIKTHPIYSSPSNKHSFSLDLSTQGNFAAKGTVFMGRPAHGSPIVARHAPRRSLRDVIVVIDPGHGGHDPGASGPRHTKEKHVTLAIASKLKQLIDKQPGMHAVLTRTGDYYIELRHRLNIARQYNGDVFVSIHADAFINHDSNGASVFALSPSGATSEAARWLAEKENYSELGGVNLSELDDKNGLVRTVLIDLSQTATIDSSLRMGGLVLRGLNQVTRLHNHKVEQARFMVLKSPDIPSILVETGFISNFREERNLTSPAYQTYLTRAIFQGIKNYFWEYPPSGTRIEALVGANTHLRSAQN